MINKQTTTRFAPSGVGGSSRVAEPANTVRRPDAGVEASIEIPAIWQNARETLRRRVGDARFDTWIARLDLIAEVNGEILIAAPGELEYDRVNREFIRDIQHAWSQADSRGRRVRLDVRDRIEPEVLALAQPAPSQPARPAAPEAPVSALDVGGDTCADEQQTLENFLVGESNRIAFGLARRLAMGASVAANVVTIIGPHGVGKTHLLKGIEAALRAARGDGAVLYMSSEDFTVAFVEGVKRKDTSDLRALVRRAKVVLLDDFQFICSKPGTLVEFFSHLRAIVSAGGVVVLAC
ncbi:MAG TPA: DnaA/Hda family protein, partial [Hyphomonadaceae bacterium]|nr:DnaA/Hda family protein [Hyphomonadaceae bacterium]